MKAGGISVILSYAIWIHHEEIENVWDFTGSKNLREFLEICRNCQLYMLLRIGKTERTKKCIADNFFTRSSHPWQIGLKRFSLYRNLKMEIETLYNTTNIYLESWPDMEKGKICSLIKIDVYPEYVLSI